MNLFNLFGKITLDTSDYEKGIDDANRKNDEFTSKTGKMSKEAKAAWAAVIAVIVKVANTIKTLILETTQYADKIKNLAQLYGYTTQEIQEMMSVAEQSGKDVEKVLRAIESSGETAAEYLGLSAEEYQEMVNSAYEFNTIIGDESLDRVDALGDRIAYLKSEWQAMLASILSGEASADAAVNSFFRNVDEAIEEHGDDIIRFAVKIVSMVSVALGDVLTDSLADIIAISIQETVFNVNWVEVGYKIITGILQGVMRVLSEFMGTVVGWFNSAAGDRWSSSTSPFFEDMKNMFDKGALYIRGDDYSVSESSRQTVDVNIKVDGDTALDKENAELVGESVAEQIDEILGRRLNG